MNEALCRLEELADPGSASFTVEQDGTRLSIMVVRQDDEVFGYVNSCPHVGVMLDFEPGRFLDSERRFILCSSHGALFRIRDGFCVSGPCAGKSLTPYPLSLKDGFVLPGRG
ncbi:Rieske (2Fe-2S) protein [Telmatospirillum sp. J64-1]|uniref:Rieske (2Fe-2S) protein n=1 Tax=Telmatospirillum sp. J64-1 TaxID=2502183 RepID=UPI00115E4590|nr:Rieske (2Fe-2S) protein [Telmatospirillum sp. J64-1]